MKIIIFEKKFKSFLQRSSTNISITNFIKIYLNHFKSEKQITGHTAKLNLFHYSVKFVPPGNIINICTINK